MQNQPTARPWLRLVSQARMEPPIAPPLQPQPPAPQPRPVVIRPAFGQALRPPTAQPPPLPQPVQPQEPVPPTNAPLAQVIPAPSSSLPPSPKPRPFAPSSSLPTSPLAVSSSLPTSPVPKAVPTTTQSPTIFKPSSQTPPQSPKIKPSAPPPSPLSLPPSQLKPDPEPEIKPLVVAEQKNVLVQEDEERRNAELQRDLGKGSRPSIAHNKDNDAHKKSADPEEVGMRVITIAGENKGAYMELSHSSKKQHDSKGIPHPRSHHPHKKNTSKSSDESELTSKSSSDEESKSKRKDKTIPVPNPPISAFVNSNVQGVNNSILFNCSYSHTDPGVHLALSRKPTGDQLIHLKDRSNGQHT